MRVPGLRAILGGAAHYRMRSAPGVHCLACCQTFPAITLRSGHFAALPPPVAVLDGSLTKNLNKTGVRLWALAAESRGHRPPRP